MKKVWIILIVVAIAAAAFYWIRNPEMEYMDDSARTGAHGSFIELTDGVTHYELSGPDTAEMIVLVHGFSVPYYIWDSTFHALTSDGYRVLRYDLFGRGYSDRPGIDYNEELYDRQLHELLTRLQIQPPVHLAGLSFGGPITSYFTQQHPEWVKTLILLDPVTQPFGEPELPEALDLLHIRLFTARSIPQSQYSDFFDPKPFEGWAERYKEQMKYKGFLHAINSTRYHYRIIPHDIFKSVAGLNKPVLLIWGEEDTTTPFSESQDVVELLHPVFVPVKEAGHLPHMEKASVVNSTIVEFIRQNE